MQNLLNLGAEKKTELGLVEITKVFLQMLYLFTFNELFTKARYDYPEKTKAPITKFGFHIPTCCGYLDQDNTWQDDWTV